ncbi:MAG TPA: SUMF1/EgtB/PvdO family nonheme iron enzyme [Polyangiaceae bacterium]|nr:SUMF1/EgtB/PvdO family nonheme iron enzyme [Polyangiaceae bacterium]
MSRSLAIVLALLSFVLAGAGIWGVVRLAARERAGPARCAPGFVQTGSRCCAPGQAVRQSRCVGEPAQCPDGMHLDDTRRGCVVDLRRIAYRGGRVSVGGDDWQSEGVTGLRSADVQPFQLDQTEVTAERWAHCVLAGACRSLDEPEPGAPVTGVDAKAAEKFCRFDGGRLPTSDEWLFAAAGGEGRRFPWGATGLVCRRASFGLERGPCATGGRPELAGARLDGATPDGALDLSGNVAEWTLEKDGRAVARGGSYRSTSAGELTTWAVETVRGSAPYVGLRCARDAGQTGARAAAAPP